MEGADAHLTLKVKNVTPDNATLSLIPVVYMNAIELFFFAPFTCVVVHTLRRKCGRTVCRNKILLFSCVRYNFAVFVYDIEPNKKNIEMKTIFKGRLVNDVQRSLNRKKDLKE